MIATLFASTIQEVSAAQVEMPIIPEPQVEVLSAQPSVSLAQVEMQQQTINLTQEKAFALIPDVVDQLNSHRGVAGRRRGLFQSTNFPSWESILVDPKLSEKSVRTILSSIDVK